jgi:hypothetical protein
LNDLAEALRRDGRWSWLRLAGGIVFAVGMTLIRVRMSDDWADFSLFLVLMAPVAVLYGLAMLGSRVSERLAAWQSAFLVTAVLLTPLMLERVAAVLGVEDPFTKSGAMFWILGLTALAAGFAARLGSSINILLSALATAGAVLFFADWVGDHPGVGTFRNTLALVAAAFAIVAFVLRKRPEESNYLVAAAGVGAVGAGVIGSSSSLLASIPLLSIGGDRPSDGWEAFLLLSCLALVAYTAARHYRATGYIAAVGLAFFVLIVGQQAEHVGFLGLVTRHTIAGWPVALTIAGLVALCASILGPRLGRPALPNPEDPERADRITPP